MGVRVHQTFEEEKVFQKKIDAHLSVEDFKMPPIHIIETPLTHINPRMLGPIQKISGAVGFSWCPARVQVRLGAPQDSLLKASSGDCPVREALLVFVLHINTSFDKVAGLKSTMRRSDLLQLSSSSSHLGGRPAVALWIPRLMSSVLRWWDARWLLST